jgi:hypothetical protein
MADCRYYQIGGLTVQVESDLPITETTFLHKFKCFEVAGPGEDNIVIRHHFTPLNLEKMDPGQLVYRKEPWTIYRKENSWIYLGLSRTLKDTEAGYVSVFNADHTHAEMYCAGEDEFRKGDLHSLSLFATDEIFLSHVLADRQGCYLHASGVILNGQGLLFVGRSGTGKSTLVKMMMGHAEILCDDRMIVRRWPPPLSTTGEGKGGGEWRIHGTWSHGEVPNVSPNSAPLRAILFLQQDALNKTIPLTDRKEIWKRLLATLIRPMVTSEWWQKKMNVLEQIVNEVPCYILHFDKRGGVVEVLQELLQE